MPALHASAVAYRGIGCLVLGPSGVGKSRLVAKIILHGGVLIGDDHIELRAEEGVLFASAAPQLAGVIELHGLGLVRMKEAGEHPIHTVLTIDAPADARLPEPATIDYLGITLPHLRLPPPPVGSVAGLLLYLEAMQEGRILPTDWRPAG